MFYFYHHNVLSIVSVVSFVNSFIELKVSLTTYCMTSVTLCS